MTTMATRVLLVDDHTVVRTGLRYALDGFEDIVTVGETANCQETMELCAFLNPDVVLMDLQLADDQDSIQTTALIRERFPHIRVIILTSFCSKELIERALQAGAVGYLMKDVSLSYLAWAVREANPDHLVLTPEANQVLLKSVSSSVNTGEKILTPRQKEVLRCLVIGYSNKEIAEKLNIRLPTARFHVSAILAKLGAANRAEAAVLAVRHHLLEPDDPSSFNDSLAG